MAPRKKTPKPTRSQYAIESDGKKAFLTRVTTILDWTIKGDGFGAMPYYGAGLLAQFLFDDLDEEAREGVMELWKQSEFDPNKTLRRRADEGSQAHKLFEHLCQGAAVLMSDEPPWRVTYEQQMYFEIEGIKEVPLDFIAAEYDAGACAAYHELFQYLDPGELLSEQRVYWTEHPIHECPDDICTHGFAGTADAIMPLHRVMGDMKTNKGDARWSAYPQMAMYGLAAEQMGLIHGPIVKQIVIIPRPDGTFDIFDDKFVGTEIVPLILELYRIRKAWGPKG